MSNPATSITAVLASGGGTPEPAARPPSAEPALCVGLTWLDEMSFNYLAKGSDEDMARLREVVRETASALYAPETRDRARLRVLARALAVTRTKVMLYEAQLDRCVAARDEQGVALIEKVLASANRRLVALLAEHRLACVAEQRHVTVAVGQAQQVNVVSGHIRER